MPEAEKQKQEPMVDIDTSGPEVEVTLPEEKKEDVVEQSGLPIINENEWLEIIKSIDV